MKRFLCALLVLLMVLTTNISVLVVSANETNVYSGYVKTEVVPKELQEKYPKNNFAVSKLGEVGEYSLYYNVTEYYKYQKYDVNIGSYIFDCFAQQSPYDLGLYVVGNNKAYTLAEAYDTVGIDMDKVYSLIKENDIHYNFTVEKAPTTVKLAKSKANLYVKGTTNIKATVKNGNEKTTYKSSNPKVAKVNSNGKVTAVKKGTAKITVTNNKVSKAFTVTVKNPKLNKTSLTLKKNKSYTLKVTGKVGKATFSTSNKKVATVNQKGKVVAKKKGKATITVKTNGMKLKCKVTVK